MYYTIYKITNKLNGKIYVGKHQTENIDDGYIGSGVALSKAILKYGKNNFHKEILKVFDNEFEMNEAEKNLIDESFISRKDTYNIGLGGEGGPHFKGRQHSEETRKLLSKISKDSYDSKSLFEKEQKRKKQKENHWSKTDPERFKNHVKNCGRYKRVPLTEEHKNKLSRANLGKVQFITECPHCKKSGGIRLMKRWHFENCKKLKREGQDG